MALEPTKAEKRSTEQQGARYDYAGSSKVGIFRSAAFLGGAEVAASGER